MLIIEHLLAYPKKQNAWKTHCTGEQCFLLSLGLLNREWVCNLIRNLKCNSSRISLSGSCVHIFYGTSIKRRVVSHVINDLRWPLWNGCFGTLSCHKLFSETTVKWVFYLWRARRKYNHLFLHYTSEVGIHMMFVSNGMGNARFNCYLYLYGMFVWSVRK